MEDRRRKLGIFVHICISEQQRLWRVYAYAHTYTQCMDVDEGSGQYLDIWLHWMCQHGRLLEAFAQMR